MPQLSLRDELKRQEADKQMRRKFKELRPLIDYPTLYGVSAFDIQVAFYENNRATCDVQLMGVTQHDPSLTSDIAPIERVAIQTRSCSKSR